MGRGEPRLHPMTIDGQITSFAQFNNANYKHSFLYLTKKTENFMRIARINVLKKINIGRYKIINIFHSQTYPMIIHIRFEKSQLVKPSIRQCLCFNLKS
jgi:hypothetical protein